MVDVIKCKSDATGNDGFQIGADLTDITRDVRLDKCKLKRAGDEGFGVLGNEVVLTKCSASVVDEEGFDVHGDDCRVEKGKATKCRRGVEFDRANGSRAIGCKITRSREDGAVFFDSQNCTVDACKIARSGADGIRVDLNSTGNTVTNNKVAGSKFVDLREENGPNGNTIADNRVKSTSTDVSPLDD